MSAFREIWRNPYVRVAVYAALLYLAYLFSIQAINVIAVAGLAYLFAYIFNPLVGFFVSKRIPRNVALIFVFVLVLFFGVFSAFLLGTIANELIQFSKELPRIFEDVQKGINDLSSQLDALKKTPQLRTVIDQATEGLQSAMSNIVGNVLGFVQGSGFGIVTNALSNVIQFFLVFIIGGYMLASFSKIGQTLLEIFPKRSQKLVLDISKDINTAVGGYIRGQIIIAIAVGTMVGIGLAIIGVPLALTLGFLSAIFNVVPYLGVVVSIAPAILLALEFGLVKVLLVIIVFIIANQIEAHFLSPVILSRSTDLHPVTVILAIVTGVAIYGVLGGLLAVPLAALAKLLLKKYWFNSVLYQKNE